MRDRTSLVLALIQQPEMASELLQELSEYGWHCEEQLAIITKQDVLAVLKQFDHGSLSSVDVTAWANSVGGRPDIGYEFGADGVVEESLYWLAHPETNWPVDSEIHHRIAVLYERRRAKRRAP
jgi:hypothetical protein